PPQPARALPRVRRDDDLVRPRLQLGECILERRDRIRLDHVARRGDALAAQGLERPLEPAAGRGAACVLVDDVALARLVDRGNDRHEERAFRAPPLQGVDQSATGNSLVRDHEPVLHRTGTSSSVPARSPLKTACRAPSTPYSYGLPTTCGISAKLKIGGGERSC